MNTKLKRTPLGDVAKQSFEQAQINRKSDVAFRLRQIEAQSAKLDNADARMYAMAEGEGRAAGTTTFGPASNRPDPTYMKTYGVNNAIYFATDTFVLSAWTGTAWKSVTLA